MVSTSDFAFFGAANILTGRNPDSGFGGLVSQCSTGGVPQ